MAKLAISKKTLYRICLWFLLIAATILLAFLAPTLSKPEYLPSDDFVPYYASGKLNILGENPYDPKMVEQIQISAGGAPSGAYTVSIVLNPPWSITFVMPFGLLPYPIGRLAWLIFSSILILVCSQVLWGISSGNPKKRWVAILAAFIFAPTISVLEVGQIAVLILVGITGFLYFTLVHRNDWMAGASLALASIKPQVALLFWLALLIWIITQRRWLVVLSAALAVFLLTLIAMIFNPQIIQQYLTMMKTYQISQWANPTIGAYLRFFLFGTDKFWLQFLPTIIGALWLIYYWFKNRSTWDWVHNLPILLLVSQITSPYTWTYDQVILIPAVILAFVWMSSNWKSRSTIVLTVAFVIINLLDLLLHRRLDDFWFIWMAPALLIWFIFSERLYRKTGLVKSISANDWQHNYVA